MQHTVSIVFNSQVLPPDSEVSAQSTDLKQAILKALNEHKEAIGFMLQGYHSREKVRHVDFEAQSLAWLGEATYVVTAAYQIEEFSVCSNTDTEEKVQMTLTVRISVTEGILQVSGIDVPEREPDEL